MSTNQDCALLLALKDLWCSGANSRINFANIPVFPSDPAASAGGLVAGDMYRNATGVVSLKL